MRVSFEWTEKDWNEAVTLATEPRARRGSISGMVYAIVGISLVGAVMDGASALHRSGKLTASAAVVPLMLLALAIAMGLLLGVSYVRRKRRVLLQAPMPTGEWEAVLQEAGWRFEPKREVSIPAGKEYANTKPAEAVLTGEAKTTAEAMPDPTAAMLSHDEAARSSNTPTVGTSAAPLKSIAHTSAPIVTIGDGPLVWVSAEAAENTADDLATAPIPPVAATPVAVVPVAAVPVAAVIAAATTAAPAKEMLHPWTDLTGSRAGDRVLVLLAKDGFHAVPVRCLTPDQASHMHRMVLRKLRPAPPPRGAGAQDGR